MVSRNLVICDQEVRYAAALAEVFMKAKELALGVQVCNSVEQTVKLQEESPVDILLIGSSYPVEDRKKIKAGNVFVLAQSENAVHETNEKLINKYQSGEAIMGAVIEQCTQSGEPERFFLRTAKKQNVRIIGIFSPVHRSKKTGYALKLGKELARTYNVLYLNLEVYGGIGGHFPDAGQTVADALYYSRQEKKHLRAALAGMVTIARMTSAQPTYGQNYEMDAIGSCFIGGASAYGGTGTVPGVIVGAVLMGVINLGMSLMGVDQNMQKVVKGLVLLAAVIFDVVSKRGGKLIAKN